MQLNKFQCANSPTPRPTDCYAIKAVHLAMLSVLTIPTAHAADIFNGLDFLSGYTRSYANAVNADGSVVVGYSSGGAGDQAFRWTQASGLVGLGFLSGGTNSQANAVSADGSVVVGLSDSTAGNRAFRWTQAGGMVDLGTLSGGSSSLAIGVSADGSVVVGQSDSSTGFQAFRWTQAGGMEGLGFLSGGTFSSANAVSADGSVVVGRSASTVGDRAFRWQAGTMTNLGTLTGGATSSANAVNADGSVVVGNSESAAGDRAFRWTQAGGMVSLGILSGGTASYANAVNADGSVVVGQADNASGQQQAFRWTQASGMISVQDWLANAGVSTSGFQRLSYASGVSNSGNTVVGYGRNTSGNIEAFIARVGDESSSGSGSGSGNGIVGLTDLANSITQSLAMSMQLENLTWLTMNGAHHRPLTEMAVGDSNSCAWVSGDAGREYRSANGYIGLAEMGGCHDFAAQGIRVGLGVGSSFSNLKLANNGNSHIQGQYGIAEIDWQIPNKPFVVSLLGVYGRWDGNLKRGYAIAGTQPSSGETNMTAYSLRARIDWQDALHLGQVGISPRVAYTVTRTEIDGYQEQGGSAPANFQDQNHTAREIRAGLTGKYELNAKVTLLGHGEVAHRLDASGASIQGNINALGLGIGFRQSGNSVSRNWVRVGAEMDYKLSERSTWNASTFASSAGQDPDMTLAVSYRLAY